MPKAKVKRVIDGDTFVIKNNMKIRIAGLDAPELNERGGKAAKKRLSKLLRGKEIGISNELRKSYDRSVRTVTVKRKPITKLLKKKR